LAGDLNAKNPFWNSAVSNPSGDKLLHLFDINQFEISAPQCHTHYSSSGNGDVLDIVVHQNIRVSDVIISDILDSDHLPIIFHILDHVTIRNLSDPIQKFTDWERLQRLVSELISPKNEITSEVEVGKATRDFTASISSAYRLSTSMITLLDLAIQIIQIGIFDQFDQTYWLFSFTKKIQSFGGRRIVNAKSNASRGDTRFGFVPYSFQYVYK
jgi:hypothetical protein